VDVRRHLHAAAASFWREWHRDLRKHAADVRIPYPIRVKLRDAAERALRRSSDEESHAVVSRVNRRAMLDAPPARLSADEAARGKTLAAAAGLGGEQPLVVVEGLNRADTWAASIPLLRAAGFQVARFRDDVGPVFHHEGVVDLPRTRRTPLLEACLVASSAFVICADPLLQNEAQIRNVPFLRLDAREPFSVYPIKPNGVFTLATTIDLDTGRQLDMRELLALPYFRNRRNCGYRPSSVADVAAATTEMIDGVKNGWHDSDSQARFRAAVAAAGTSLAADVPEMIEWDTAGGFVGEGRLARVQAERAL
jgi:hypothetical protein